MFKGHGGKKGLLPGKEHNDILDFSANINPLGYPEGVRTRILKNFDTILHYPDIDCTDLKRFIAQKIARSPDEIIVGNGSTELFYLIPRALRPEKGITFQPTFSEFAEALKCSNTQEIPIPLEEKNAFSFSYKRKYFRDSKAKLAFLCNPNNPTGQLTDREVILSMARKHSDVTFVVDEAFMDFVGESEKYSVANEVGDIKNLIVVKSLTKFYGFPGLRVGYLVANADIVKMLTNYKEPWTVNSFAQYAVMEAMGDTEFISRSREFVSQEKRYLRKELSNIPGILPFKPAANFIFVKILLNTITSAFLYDLLLEHDIAIRDCSNFRGLDDTYFRVAVRTRKENKKLVQTLKRVLISAKHDVVQEQQACQTNPA
ncbi:MAG: threonine-phosphate decarboxylase CobD [Candidatus Brocadiaceae bacterium]|nr:threonine-phosphate decarboxylase CobD [Candidatus Brocadiaceae bacterium]